MQGDVLVFVSGGNDRIGLEFHDYCRKRDLQLLLATEQSQTQFYYELPAGPALLRIEQPGGGRRDLQPEELRGIWYRRLPDSPPEVDEEDAIYSAAEFAAAFVGFLRSTRIPCFGHSRDEPFRSSLSRRQVRSCSNRLRIPLLPEPDIDPLLPIPLRDYLCAPQMACPGGAPSFVVPKRSALPDGIYYVVFSNRRQILAQDGVHSPEQLARARQVGDRIAANLRLESAVIEMAVEKGGTIALGSVAPYVTDNMILRDSAWYFDAVLEGFSA